MRRKGMKGLVITLGFTVIMAGLTITKEWKPLLGLDLQGGVMVVLGPQGNPAPDKLETAMQIMEQRINALGVAEPDIRLEGGKIVVQIAGIKDRDRAVKLVGETAELRFRPVLADLPPDAPDATTPGSTPGTTPGSTPGTTPSGTAVPGSVDPAVTVPGAVPGAPGESTTTTTAVAAPTSQQGAFAGASSGEVALGQQTPPTVGDVPPTSVSPPTVAPSVVPSSIGPTPSSPAPADPSAVPSVPGAANPLPADGSTISPEQMAALQAQMGGMTTTKPEDDKPDQVVVLPVYDESGTKQERRVQLGPALLTGNALEDASATLSDAGQWIVRPRFKPGADGIDKFNAAAGKCFSKATECPTQRLAITLDGRVITDPNIKVATFQADQIEISGSFTETSAREVATKLRYGALPVVLNQDQVTEVSATLGKDALNAGIIAGAVGLGLVVLYMVAFYRMLGVLAMVKLLLEAVLLWSIISFLGENAGLALTLAGLTGIIMSIGVSLDSNVVFYEHLKEDIRNGRTYRSAVDKSFEGAFRTIVKADGVSVLGAALLYFLTVGPVRGFAFYLGLSTILDLITSYYYMRPMVAAAVRSDFAVEHPGLFGLPRPEEVERSTLARVARRVKAAGAADAVPARAGAAATVSADAPGTDTEEASS